MAFAEDLDEFLDEDEFATSVTQDTKTFLGVYTDEYDGTFEVEGARPQIVAKDSDLAAAPATSQGSALTVSGKGSFQVQEIQPDGTGMSTVYLEKV